MSVGIEDEVEGNKSWKEWLMEKEDPVVAKKLEGAEKLRVVWMKREDERKMVGDEERRAELAYRKAVREAGKAAAKAKDAAVEYGEALLGAWTVAAKSTVGAPAPGGLGDGGEANGYAKFAMAYEGSEDLEEAFNEDGTPNRASDAWMEWKDMKRREHGWLQNAMREGEDSEEVEDEWEDLE